MREVKNQHRRRCASKPILRKRSPRITMRLCGWTYGGSCTQTSTDTASLSRVHAGTCSRAPPTGSCSSRIRRCCPNLFLNFLSRFPLATARGDERRFESYLRVGETLYPGRSWQIQELSSPRFAGNPSDGGLVQQDPCLCCSHGNNWNRTHVQFRIDRRLDNLSRSIFMACRVRVAMHEEQVKFSFSR